MIHVLGMNKAAYNIQADTKDSFEWYTELGWEVVAGRTHVVRMINTGKIAPSDTIVTLKDRMFMYTKLHSNVKEWVLGIEPIPGGIRPDNFGDYCSNIFHTNGVQDTIYKFPQDIPMLINHDYEEVNPPVCAVINHRKRGWYPVRNIKESTTQNLVSMCLDLGIKPYISGMNAENIDSRAEYVPTLRKVASLMHHPNCKAFIGSGGPSLLAQQCCSSKLIFLNTCGSIGVNALFLQDRMNFAKHKMFVVGPDDVEAVKIALLA